MGHIRATASRPPTPTLPHKGGGRRYCRAIRARQPTTVAVALRDAATVEILQHLNGEVAPDAAHAVEISGREGAVFASGELLGNRQQSVERRRQKESIRGNAVNP